MKRTQEERYTYILDRAEIAIAHRMKARGRAEKERTSRWCACWMMATGVRPFPRPEGDNSPMRSEP